MTKHDIARNHDIWPGVIADLGPDQRAPDALARIAVIDPATLPLIEGRPRCGLPVAGTRQRVAVGLNYADHAAESNLPIPTEPVVFNEWVSWLQGAKNPVTIPRGSIKTDWEVEHDVVIGTHASDIDDAGALAHAAG
jgi:2-keto-4-pentenoate hydratase/2-oxohepta-3-ene-1,7-dioic acid hydratase in catechol pathway